MDTFFGQVILLANLPDGNTIFHPDRNKHSRSQLHVGLSDFSTRRISLWNLHYVVICIIATFQVAHCYIFCFMHRCIQ